MIMGALYDFLRRMKVAYNHQPHNTDIQLAVKEALEEYEITRTENERLQNQVDTISELITQFKKARNTTRSIEAISKIIVWNVE